MGLASTDLSAIETIHANWLARERDGRTASILEFCVEDVVFLPPDAAPLVGKTSVAVWLAANRVTIRSLEVAGLTVCGAGRLAALSARYATTWLATDGEHRAEGGQSWLLRKAIRGLSRPSRGPSENGCARIAAASIMRRHQPASVATAVLGQRAAAACLKKERAARNRNGAVTVGERNFFANSKARTGVLGAGITVNFVIVECI